MSNGIWSVSRSWLLYLDDLIASAEKIGRLTAGHTITQFVADEAAFDAVLFNLQVIGEAIKKLPANARALLPEADRSGPARLRDLKRLQQHDGQSLGRLVSDLLAQSLAAQRAAQPAPKPFQWSSQAMGLRIDLRDKDALLDALDDPAR